MLTTSAGRAQQFGVLKSNTMNPSLIFREKGDILLEKRKEKVLNPMYKI